MPDDKKQTAPQDAARINVNEDYEVRYWTRKFGCSEDELKKAVAKVGVSKRAIEEELRRTIRKS